MMNLRPHLTTALMISVLALALPRACRAQTSARQAIGALNQKEADAWRTMNHADDEALWAEDGVDLIEGMDPMVGKLAISRWLDSLTPQLKGAKMEYCTIDWHDLQISGDWAYEWGITRQKIDFPPPRKTVLSEGKMLLILKRQPDGSWKIKLESWNSNPVLGVRSR